MSDKTIGQALGLTPQQEEVVICYARGVVDKYNAISEMLQTIENLSDPPWDHLRTQLYTAYEVGRCIGISQGVKGMLFSNILSGSSESQPFSPGEKCPHCP